MATKKKTEFVFDNESGEYLVGYLRGVADTVNTPQYIGSAVDFAEGYLSNRLELAIDQTARLQPDLYHHVYEWGDSWATRHDNVGDPENRLWKIVSSGTGQNKNVGFVFLPSLRPTPIHPKEEKVGVESGKHIFTWKAPVMEYGQTVTIEPVEAAKGKLVFYWEKIGKVVATTKTIRTQVDQNVVGMFTALFVKWWNTEAPVIFRNEIKPHLESNVVPRGPGGRFMKGRSKAASKALRGGGGAGTMQSLGIDRASEAKGYAEAVKSMKSVSAGYKQGRGGYENYGH